MPNICLVTSEIVGPFKNGGIGTHNYYLMQYLSKTKEVNCTIIYNGAIENESYEYWKSKFKVEYDTEFIWISPTQDSLNQKTLSSCHWERVSQANLDYLKKNQYDIVLFQEMLGGGFRSIQAKRTLGFFEGTLLAVMVHSSWQWVNESMQLFPVYGLPEMQTKYMERYSVQYCDALISPSQYMLDWSATDVESLPKFQRIIPYLFDPFLRKASPKRVASELIFFGRLEQRKGLILFLDSLNAIKKELSTAYSTARIPVYFLGRAGQTEDGDGLQTIQRYRSLLNNTFEIHIISTLGHHEALEFLRNHPKAMVVCPSLQDNSPFAVIENILLETNLISCRTGGIPELFADESRLAEPTVPDLSRLIIAGLTGNLPNLQIAYSIESSRAAWKEFLSINIAQTFGPVHNPRAIATSNISQLPMIVLEAKPISPEMITAQANNRIILRGELLLSNPRALIDEAQAHSHLLLIGSSYGLEPTAESVLISAIHTRPDYILTGYTEYRFAEPLLDAPLGPCLEAVLAENALGNGVVVLPTSILTQIDARGLTLMHQMLKDPEYFWSFLSHLAISGHPIDVIPQTLCFTSKLHSLPLSQRTIYTQRSEIITSMSSQLPRWTQRLLPYVTDIGPSQNNTSNIAVSSRSDGSKSLPSLLRYYWERSKAKLRAKLANP